MEGCKAHKSCVLITQNKLKLAVKHRQHTMMSLIGSFTHNSPVSSIHLSFILALTRDLIISREDVSPSEWRLKTTQWCHAVQSHEHTTQERKAHREAERDLRDTAYLPELLTLHWVKLMCEVKQELVWGKWPKDIWSSSEMKTWRRGVAFFSNEKFTSPPWIEATTGFVIFCVFLSVCFTVQLFLWQTIGLDWMGTSNFPNVFWDCVKMMVETL